MMLSIYLTALFAVCVGTVYIFYMKPIRCSLYLAGMSQRKVASLLVSDIMMTVDGVGYRQYHKYMLILYFTVARMRLLRALYAITYNLSHLFSLT